MLKHEMLFRFCENFRRTLLHKWLIIILVLFSVNGLVAQIHIKNGSFEIGDSCLSFSIAHPCNIDSFSVCEPWTEIHYTGFDDNGHSRPNNAYDGNQFVFLRYNDTIFWYPGSNNAQGSFSQKLDCNLQKGKTYRIAMALSSAITLNPNYDLKVKSYCAFWGGLDTCDKEERLWLSPLLDSAWRVLDFSFTPQLYDYSYVVFACDTSININGAILIDSISDIYPYNANDISVNTNDTTVIKSNSCVSLSSQPKINSYDSLYWFSIPVGYYSNLQNPGVVCPDSTTYYIVAMHDTTMTCAGTWWSYDTVKVHVVDSLTGIKNVEREVSFVGFPNPATDEVQFDYNWIEWEKCNDVRLTICDVRGTTVMQQEVPRYSTKQNFSVKQLAAGVYTVQLYRNGLSGNKVSIANCKLVKQ